MLKLIELLGSAMGLDEEQSFTLRRVLITVFSIVFCLLTLNIILPLLLGLISFASEERFGGFLAATGVFIVILVGAMVFMSQSRKGLNIDLALRRREHRHAHSRRQIFLNDQSRKFSSKRTKDPTYRTSLQGIGNQQPPITRVHNDPVDKRDIISRMRRISANYEQQSVRELEIELRKLLQQSPGQSAWISNQLAELKVLIEANTTYGTHD